jgi:geranylgeranyl diphosphate synthase type I
MRDDILGVWGDESTIGKPLGADIRRHKKSLPIVCGLNAEQSGAGDELRVLYSKPGLDDDDVKRVLRVLEGAGAREYCTTLAAKKKNAALRELGQLELKPRPAAELREAAEFLLEREF